MDVIAPDVVARTNHSGHAEPAIVYPLNNRPGSNIADYLSESHYTTIARPKQSGQAELLVRTRRDVLSG